jgi:hypothetical protein
MMNYTICTKKALSKTGSGLVLITAILLIAIQAFGHSGKEHAEGSFTPLQALLKATNMYDQLISTNKLGETWETHLVTIEISARGNSGNKELVVSFSRSIGNSETVYIFFSEDGEYIGSNFTGK